MHYANCLILNPAARPKRFIAHYVRCRLCKYEEVGRHYGLTSRATRDYDLLRLIGPESMLRELRTQWARLRITTEQF